MLTLICPQHCPSPFCEIACPASALTVEDQGVYLDRDKCNRCGICRVLCLTWSRDRALERRRPWVSSRSG